MDFITHPKNIKSMAEEIKRAVDAYWRRELDEKKLREYLFNWAKQGLLQGYGFNPTITKIIGTKRLRVVESQLQGYQPTIKP
jgi:uncharacterized protein (TIGR04540 family)